MIFLQLSRDLNLFECLNHIAFLKVVEVCKIQTAIETCNNLFHIIFESLKRFKLTGEYYNTVAYDTHLRFALNLTLFNHTAGNCTNFVNLECLKHFEVTVNLLFNLW